MTNYQYTQHDREQLLAAMLDIIASLSDSSLHEIVRTFGKDPLPDISVDDEPDEFPELPETHNQGSVMLNNLDIIEQMQLSDCDLGLRIGEDGRVWVCINGVNLLTFKLKKEA